MKIHPLFEAAPGMTREELEALLVRLEPGVRSGNPYAIADGRMAQMLLTQLRRREEVMPAPPPPINEVR